MRLENGSCFLFVFPESLQPVCANAKLSHPVGLTHCRRVGDLFSLRMDIGLVVDFARENLYAGSRLNDLKNGLPN